MKIPFRTILLQALVTALLTMFMAFGVSILFERIESSKEHKFNSDTTYFELEGPTEMEYHQVGYFRLIAKNSNHEPDKFYKGTIRIVGSSLIPKEYTFTENDEGIYEFTTWFQDRRSFYIINIHDINDYRLSGEIVIQLID